MRKISKIVLVIITLMMILIFSNNNSVNASIKIDKLDAEIESKLKATKLGIGGGGALFEPAISPFNSNEMLVVPDMGGIYISHDKGEHWERENLYGTVMSATYDPNREGVIYAGGSGLYRSTDNGDNFELIFPRKDDIIARLTHNENGLQYYFTNSDIYDRNKYVKNILIDPEDSNHIFILCYSYKNGKVLESTDNGENFQELFTYSKSTCPSIQFDFNELIYRRETRDIFVINDEKIIGYNLESKEENVYESNLGLVDVSTVYEDGKTYFIIIEKTDELDNSDTKVYYTNDFENKVDITESLTSVQPTTFHNNTYGDVTYKYNFAYISATSLNNIYITNWSYQSTSSIKKYPYTIDGIIRYHEGTAKYLYGNPFKDHNNLASRGWCDGNTYSLGISASKQNEDEFLFTTLCGIYYSENNTQIYPRYSTVTEGTYPNSKYVTNGIDEQVTYGVIENPFNRDVLLLLNTDLGMIRSEDGGKSWVLADKGIPSKWTNTAYDAVFDERKENVVYSLWSGRHIVPYSAGNETDNRYGGFAFSKDCGKTWDVNYSSGLPENATPAKMSVVYPEDSDEAIIYVATFNKGFFVSYDSGKNFTEMNKGIEKISYKDEEKYQYILAADIEVQEGHIFGITAKSSYNGETQPGKLYEYVDGEWQKIELPKNVKTPKDIYFKDGILYISGIATPIWDNKNGTDFNNYSGGVYAYENGNFTQIFDESISTTSVQIDSKGTMYVSDINGNIYRKEKGKDYQKIYDDYFYISKGLQISYNDDYLYLSSFGGGLLKLENLNSFYDKGLIELEANPMTIKQGEEVTLSLKLNSDITANVIKANINYDSNVWEELEDDDFVVQGNWEGVKYNKTNREFILVNKQENIQNEFLQIKLKAKEDANLGKTKVTIEDIIISSEEEELQGRSEQEEIIIKAKEVPETPDKPVTPENPDTPDVPDKPATPEEPDTPDKPVTPENPNTPNIPDNSNKTDKSDNNSNNNTQEQAKPNNSKNEVPTQNNISNTNNMSNTNNTINTKTENNFANSNNSNNVVINKSNVDNTKSTSKIPKTGVNNIFIIVLIIVAVIISLVLFIKNKKYKNTLILLVISGILIGSNITFASPEMFLGDVSQNSVIDNRDIEILEEYLISLRELEIKEQADLNNDNKISLIDLSLLIKKQIECPYDKYNVTGISYWTPVPMVSEELLKKDEVTTGGEGCQWPIGMDISKDGQLILYGTDVGGVYRSEDGGKNFVQSNAGLGSRGVGAFSIDPTNSKYVIAQGINSYSYDTNGLYISEDGGKSWQMTKMMLIKGHRDIRDSILYDESSYDSEKNRCMIAYWSTAYDTEDNQLKEDEKGLYKTTDGGYTWSLINSELCDGTIKINPYTGEVYVSKADGIYYSNDKGATFAKIVENVVTGFDLIATKEKNVYLYYCNETELYKSEDGQEFEKIKTKNYPIKKYEKVSTLNIRVSPIDPNKMVIVNREAEYIISPYYSEDGGITWQKSVLDNELSFMPCGQRVSIPMWSNVENKVWLFVQGDFASSSIDGGKTFKWDSNGITGILCGGNIHYNVYNPDIIYFGSQDYDGCVTTDGGKTWKYVSMSGSNWGGFCYGGYAVDENTYFVGVSEGDKNSNPRKLKITFDGGKTVVDTGMYFTQTNLRASIESSYQSPNNPKVLFACDLRSDDGGHTWKKMDGCINVYTHNPKGKKELYGMDESAEYIVVSYDDGVTWSKVNNEKLWPNPNFDPLKIDDIAYDWKNESVYVAAGWGYLYRVSVNTGESEFVLNKYWDKYKNAPLNSKGTYVITKVAVDPNDPNIVYCGGAGNSYLNDCSLYRSVDGGKSFQVVTSNTSNSIIKSGQQGGFETNSIEVNPRTGELLFSGGCFGISKLSPPYKLNEE